MVNKISNLIFFRHLILSRSVLWRLEQNHFCWIVNVQTGLRRVKSTMYVLVPGITTAVSLGSRFKDTMTVLSAEAVKIRWFFSSQVSKQGNVIIAVIFWVCPLSSRSFSPVWNINKNVNSNKLAFVFLKKTDKFDSVTFTQEVYSNALKLTF